MALSKITNASVADTAVHGRRNMVINGSMIVNQRGDATGVTGSSFRACDRWSTVINSSGTFSISQSTESPTGFTKSLKWDCTTADSTPNYFVAYYQWEGQDVQHLLHGTSDAKKLTLQFWIRANKTGTFNTNIRSYDSSNNDRMAQTSFTIDTADTWEKKIVTFPADTGGNGPRNNTSMGLLLEIWFAAGSGFTSGTSSTSWTATANTNRAADQTLQIGSSTDDEIYLTGVQLEVGDKSTPFEHRSYGEELASCQRYFQYFPSGAMGRWNSSTAVEVGTSFPVPMRAKPTMSINPADATCYIFRVGITVNTSTITAINSIYASDTGAIPALTTTNTSTPSAGEMAVYDTDGTKNAIFCDAEL